MLGGKEYLATINPMPKSRCFNSEFVRTSGDLNCFVSDATTIAQSQCERCEDYADIEALVWRLPIKHLTFAAHDSLAPYSGPYPMAIHV